MASNYPQDYPSEMVREHEIYNWAGEYQSGPAEGTLPQNEVPCKRCHGTGLVEIFDQETDCIDCEGYGSVLI